MNRNRLLAMIYKEFMQISRDASTFLIGIILPIMLMFLIGSGMSLDVKHVSVGVVLEDTSPTARDVVSFVNGSPYFSPQYMWSMKDAVNAMDHRQVDAIIRVPSNFTSELHRGHGQVQVILYGVDTSISTSVRSYIESGIATWNQEHATKPVTLGPVVVFPRQWFNDANSSTYMFIPGLIVIVMTLVGVFLTALVMAREWERGTLESVFITPVKPVEIVLAKVIPYFTVALLGFLFCLLVSHVVYDVPIAGSFLLLLFTSMEYILVTLGMGLTISSIVKSQFIACQLAILVSLLPTVMLSGFIFDLHSVPTIISAVGHALPATYYMEAIKTLLLAGNNMTIITRDAIVLAFYAIVLLITSVRLTQKRLA